MLRVRSEREAASPRGDYHPDPRDRSILAAIEDGLPLVEQPYRAVAEQLDLDQAEIIDRLDHLSAAGIVTRFGCVVRHDKLGFNSNAMAVWDVPDDMVDSVAASFTRNPHVTLCYRGRGICRSGLTTSFAWFTPRRDTTPTPSSTKSIFWPIPG